MTENQWLLLDNLMHGWNYYTSMTSAAAEAAMSWAESNGFVDCNGRITDEGRGYFAAHGHERIEVEGFSIR